MQPQQIVYTNLKKNRTSLKIPYPYTDIMKVRSTVNSKIKTVLLNNTIQENDQPVDVLTFSLPRQRNSGN